MLIGAFVTILLLLLISSIQVAVSLGLTGQILLFWQGTMPFQAIAQNAFKSVNNYALAAIPFFILAGEAVMKGDLGKKVIELANLVLARVWGGLAVATMITSTFFGAVSGSSVASCAALGKVTTELMSRENYPKRMIAGLTAVGGTLGLMIPPSLSFIIIGGMVGIPIIDLFTAGIVPGVLEGIILTVVTYVLCRINNWGPKKEEPFKFPEFKTKFGQAFGVLIFPVIVLGGIYGGLFTPTEAAGVAAIYSVFLITIVYKTSSVRDVWQILRGSLLQSGMIYFIIIGGNLLGFMVTSLGITKIIIDFVNSLGMDKYMFLMVINVVLLFLGCFLDGVSLVILTTPIIFPLAISMGINPIHFAVTMTANIEIATLTPPVGLNLYVMSGISGLSVDEVARGIGPFYVVRICMLLLITYVPALSLLLIN